MSHETTTDRGTDSTYPFAKDPWYAKAVVLLFTIGPVLGLGYAIWSFWGHGVEAWHLLLLGACWLVTGISISVGFHRMLTHRSLVLRAPARFVLLACASMAMQGPAADWAATHLRHHAKADREGDPHSPLEGFWHAHMGWLLRDRFVRSGPAYEKLMEDPVTRFVTKTWYLWATLSLLIPAFIGLAITGTLVGFLQGILWGGLVRVALGHHITWSVNSLGHMFGSRPFDSPDRARNNFFVALVGWGEGWHNNHHAFPRAAFIGMRWYQVDMGAWLIRLLQALGQVRKIVQPSPEEKKAKLVRSSSGAVAAVSLMAKK